MKSFLIKLIYILSAGVSAQKHENIETNKACRAAGIVPFGLLQIRLPGYFIGAEEFLRRQGNYEYN